jgi:hypothetical protein
MSLQSRLGELITAIGADVKEVQLRDQMIIADTEPILTEPGSIVWVNEADDPPTLWLVEAV